MGINGKTQSSERLPLIASYCEDYFAVSRNNPLTSNHIPRDIGALLDFIKSDMGQELDSNKIAVMGGSCKYSYACLMRAIC